MSETEIDYELNGFSMERHGSGYHIVLHLFVPTLKAGMTVEEVAQAVIPRSVGDEDDTANSDDAGAGEAGEAAEDTRSARGSEEEEAPEGEADEGVSGDPTDAPSAGRGSRRGRRTGSTSTDAEKTDARSSGPEPTRTVARGRRRSSAKVEQADAKPAERQSRRGRGGASRGADKAPSIAEVMKAATAAAEKHGPARVMEMVEECGGVSRVNDIPEENRQQFIDLAMGE